MKLLVDANVSYRIVVHLRSLGHDVVSALEERPEASDSALLARAFKEQRIIVTYDKDFGELVFYHHHKHEGVVLLRVRRESFHVQREVLDRFFQEHRPRDIRGSFWTVTDTTVRQVLQ